MISSTKDINLTGWTEDENGLRQYMNVVQMVDGNWVKQQAERGEIILEMSSK